MANTFNVQILQDGPRNTAVKVAAILTASDLAQTNIILPANVMSNPADFLIDHIDYIIQDGLEVQLLWSGSTDQIGLPLAGRGRLDFSGFGGLPDPRITGWTGGFDVLTTGYATITGGTGVFTLVLELIKRGGR